MIQSRNSQVQDLLQSRMSFLSNSRIDSLPTVWLAIVLLGIGTVGCDSVGDRFESNRIFAKRWELTESIDLSEPLADSEVVLTEFFGTPDEPKWPKFLNAGKGELVSLQNLERVAGAFSSGEKGEHKGLFREHCVVCHGVNGNGRGPSSALLTPYPRDFRLGKVKFKSTPIGHKPTKEDLKKILHRGIAGTSMPSFSTLVPEDIDALVDYVIYLSIRGELERKLIRDAAIELDLEGGERLYDPGSKEKYPEEFAEVRGRIEEWAVDIQESWFAAENAVVNVVGPPKGFPLVGSGVDAKAAAASVANGKKLFQGTIASCAFCHGAEAEGDGQTHNYDDWTREWTVMAGLNPKDKQSLEPMVNLGALKPTNIFPRNLTMGVFHGGSSPEELYTRIVNGIEGTGMPAAPLKPANSQGLTNEEVWDLVNYLRSFLPVEDQSLESQETNSDSFSEEDASK